jgi:hypothetical protein
VTTWLNFFSRALFLVRELLPIASPLQAAKTRLTRSSDIISLLYYLTHCSFVLIIVTVFLMVLFFVIHRCVVR